MLYSILVRCWNRCCDSLFIISLKHLIFCMDNSFTWFKHKKYIKISEGSLFLLSPFAVPIAPIRFHFILSKIFFSLLRRFQTENLRSCTITHMAATHQSPSKLILVDACQLWTRSLSETQTGSQEFFFLTWICKPILRGNKEKHGTSRDKVPGALS